MRGNLKSSTRICFNHALQIKSRILVSLGILRNGMNIFGCGWTIRLNSPLNFGENSTRMVHPLPNMFKPSEVLPFSRFYRNSRNFCTFFPQLAVPGYSEKTEVPKMADFKSWIVTLIQFSKPFMTRPWAGLLSSLMLTEFLQHNCSLLVKKDFSFCRRYLIFLLLLLSSATESSD